MQRIRSLTILSYNIHKGFSTSNINFVLRKMRESIRSVTPDIVFLQEVVGANEKHANHHADWPTESQFEFLADKVWPHFAYGKNAVYPEGHHGNAILSKFPIVAFSNIDLSTNPFEQRGVLHAEVALPGHDEPLHCLCLHLGLTRRGRKLQLERICDRIDEEIPVSASVILAGDFNDWSKVASATLARHADLHEAFKQKRGRYAATFPAALPLLALDRIYTRNLTVHEAAVLTGPTWRKLSDHAALLAELHLPPP